MKPILIGILLAASAAPAFAADLGAGYAVPAAEYTAPEAEAVPVKRDYEVRRYYTDTGRAYGEPVTYYALITPAPPDRFIYVNGVRGPARIEIDDRPPFPGPDWIKLIK
jgi:hypothetical protein